MVHVPKTGGTSIEDTLGLKGPRHNTAVQYRHRFPVIWEEYFTFGIVRNPWDRVFSFYIYRRQIRRLEIENSLSFKQWLIRSAEYVNSNNQQALNKEFAPVYGVGTMVKNNPEGWRVKFDNSLHMLTDQNGKVIVDHIGRFERLQQEFDLICDRLDIKKQVLPFSNKTEHRPYWTYYDKDCERIVAKLFDKDIAYFKYNFGEQSPPL
ncbi:MAG: sulfotransferase family 2 domain-containing protein [Gammaproteobacteria bacterium]|nr:sulfotransferase family 2 domain-containing protein [Gammaproteobacteria bacterium]